MAPVSPMADLCPLCGVPSFPPALPHNSCPKVVRFPYTAILEAHFISFLKLLFPHTPICWQDTSFYKLTSVKYKIDEIRILVVIICDLLILIKQLESGVFQVSILSMRGKENRAK